MNISKREYQKLVQREEKGSPLALDCAKAFVIGGLLCMIGEGVSTFWKSRGLAQPESAAATAITMVLLGAVLTGLHVYDKLAKHAGAGTLVPITGFANAIVSCAMEFRSEGLIMGLGARMYQIAGPVLTYGITASVAYGIILYIIGLL